MTKESTLQSKVVVKSIERTDTQINASVYADINNNIDQYPLEPIDMNLSMKSVSVCLNE